ncbi:histidine kinase/DNA gyrase B/HSP90-like ATPase [Kineothrix alysoides]|uniref:Histidine kinase/DNA gyrase B/HSP90-like ATPase n=1 Tax=Kineothrix alysoides TaxID=1469948 RepID=A0A4R1R622_9FIRM|nr:histidine kinase [Kineothrix alysoides]TCL60938.1 histidine kinase/DNA gyrase B/HSP90-like ATPase [Kineothrix alysoides]
MDKFVGYLRKISIRRRLLYAFIILCVIPISIMIIISGAIEFLYYNDNIKRNYDNFTYESDIRVNDMFDQLELKFKYLKENNDILTDIYLYAISPIYQTEEVSNRIENTIASIVSNQEEISYAAIILEDGTSFSYMKILVDAKEISKGLEDGPSWSYVDYGQQPALCRTEMVEVDYTSGLKARYVILINLNAVKEVLDNAAGSAKQKIAITDIQDRVVAGSRFEKPELFYEVTVPILDTGLNINNTFIRTKYDLRGLITVTVIFLLVVAGTGSTSYLVHESIKIPLNRLLGRMERIEEGDIFIEPEEEADINSQDENEILNRVFTSMLNKLNEVLEETYTTNINETQLRTRIKELELVALQQRINPHFLYNLLDNIFWIAQMNNYEEIGEMVSALGEFFKTSVSEKGAFVSINTEIENVKSYVCLQKIMHKNQFDVIWKIDPGIVHYKTVKLILQPIIENCISHGFEGIEGGGIIHITGKKEADTIIFEIQDNGRGMEKDVCDGITLAMNDSILGVGDSIGMRNVNQRIKIYFGEPYGINIKSKITEGTTVSLCIPVKE